MGREKQAVLFTAGRRFRLHDVSQSGDGNLDSAIHEYTPLVPDGFEVEAGHDERQVHLELAEDGSHKRAAPNHGLGNQPIVRSVEGLGPAPEREPAGFTNLPCPKQVLGIQRQ